MQLTTWTWSSHHQHGQSYGRRPRQGLCADVRSLSTTCKTAQLMFFKRWMTTGLTDDMLRKEMDKLTDKFMEAKELLDDARDSMGSVYFNEDLQDADRAVEETLAEYKHLLSQLDEAQRQTVTRSIGLRMEELAAQQKMIRETLGD